MPITFVVAGLLLVSSAISSDGTDLRAGRYSDLDSLVKQQSKELEGLRTEAAELNDQVTSLSAGLGNGDVAELQAKVDKLRGPAGLEPVEGPGVVVTLDDAPEEIQKQATGIDPNLLVVHQQDLQAVANALWAGGAEAMTLQGQRIVSTTGIKCVGNTVVLHQVPYAPPYVIKAVGDTEAMLASLAANPYVNGYLTYVDRWQLGWDVETETDLDLPGYEGQTTLRYARPAGGTGEGDDRT